jgi:hypothetical protein
MDKNTTEQVSTPKVHKNKLNPPNPNGKGGFGENPEHRNPGGWKKENTISYQYNRFMNMTEKEIEAWTKTSKTTATMAEQIAFAQVNEARTKKGLMHAKEISDRTEGKAKETVIWDGNLTGSLDVKGVDDGALTSRIRGLVQAAAGAKAGSDRDSGGNESPQSQQANG